MSKFKGIGAAVLLLLTSAHSQIETPTDEERPPSDLHYTLAIKDGRKIFHLGEAIEVEESYSADVSKKYLLLSQPQQVKGHAAQITMEPGQDVIDRVRDDGKRSAYSILHANCLYGFGTGIGSGCGDCDTRRPLTSSPVRIPLNLTRQFQITRPGHYSLNAKPANVVLTPLDTQASVPVTLTSNKLEIDVVEDPQWSREKLWAATDRFEKAQSTYIARGWNNVPMDQMGTEGMGERINLEAEMQEAAETMQLLDTEDSLAEIVRRYDGVNIGWDHYRYILYHGIIQSKHSSLVIDFLSERMLQPDFWVSEQVIDQLTAMKLQSQFPTVFDSNNSSHQKHLYPEARRILHDYVLAVGKSLAEKDSNAYAPSLNVFNMYAKQDFCTANR